MTKNSLISIIISTKYKPWSVISNTLNSIVSSDFKDFEIILVDQNKHGDISSKISSDIKYKDIRCLNSTMTGLSKGRNSGITHSHGEWLLFFDDDAIMPADVLGKIAMTLNENKGIPLIFYGNVLTTDTNKPYLAKAALAGDSIGLFNFDSVCSIALIFNRKIFDDVGLFDESLGAGVEFGSGEESDVILRTLRKGFEIKRLNDFTVYHPSPAVSDLQKRISYGMGTGAIYKKHIFSSLHFFVILGPKLLVMILLRALLIISNFHSTASRNFHLYFLRGCVKGFIQYKGTAHNNSNK